MGFDQLLALAEKRVRLHWADVYATVSPEIQRALWAEATVWAATQSRNVSAKQVQRAMEAGFLRTLENGGL